MATGSRGGAAPGRWPIVAEAAVVAASSYLIAGVLELALIRVFEPTELELTWVSDVLLASALGVAVYLWRHLSATRLELAVKEREQLVLDTQLAIAADMQRRLLPRLPHANDGLTWAADLTPAGRIGGDFYDIVRVSDARYLVLVADVSGKGVPAAMALSTVRAAFRSLAAESSEPARLLGQLSSRLFEQWEGGPYITAIICLVDAGHGALTYANAGHPSGVVAGPGHLHLMEPTGPAAAILTGARYQQRDVPLRAGDVVVFVSDGVTEALGDAGAARLQQQVRALAEAGSSAEETCAQVMSLAKAGTGPEGVEDWQDDRTVVAVAMSTVRAEPADPGAGAYAAVATRGRAERR
jgi:sigma-B regulation protein RsbU (phosphoserine phosphatase)